MPRSSVHIRTSLSSTAKCTTQRPNSNSRSRGSRSRWYCSTASSTVCLVRLFFSSKVAIGQAVDEQAQVERAARFVAAVGELAGDREAVLGVQRLGLGVARRGRAVEQVEMQRPVRDALAQHVDDAALADLAREAGEELEAVDVLGVVHVGHRQLLERFGLGGAQEGEELRHVERVGAVVVLRALPAR